MMAACWGLIVQRTAEAEKPVSGIDQSLFSDKVSPGDNFYLYANQKWLDTTEIPADKSNYGIFTLLNDETQKQVRKLIEQAAMSNSAAGSAAQKVGDLYGSVVDVRARNQAGMKPIESLLDLINQAESKQTLGAVMGTLRRHGVYAPVVPYVSVDARNSDRYTVYLTQGGLTLPDRDYYLSDELRYVELREQLKQYITDMLRELEVPQPAQAAEVVLAIESKIALAHWTKTENRDPQKTYNKHTPEELYKRLGGFPWQTFAEYSGFGGRQEYVVRQPSFFDALGELYDSHTLEDWQNYLRFHTLDSYASALSERLEERHFQFHGTAISGVTEQEELWKRGVNTTGSVLGELVGQLYVEKHFKPQAKRRMNQLVDNLKLAFRRRIESRDWMGEGTKKQALEKLSMFTTKIGYPDQWKDYSKLSIKPAALAANLIASAEFELARDLAKLDGPIDRNEWHMTPQTINAYYNPTMNEIVFPAAILQPPFFNMNADDAANYGAIGAVIGHELSHGFDDKGSQYDGKGNLRQWWTEEDREE
ncbi:MAG: M13 family metallopeptidase, partial [Pirellulales bacterium]|nr:M13 family metallopeptidase [Pirellulales bacterium]